MRSNPPVMTGENTPSSSEQSINQCYLKQTKKLLEGPRIIKTVNYKACADFTSVELADNTTALLIY